MSISSNGRHRLNTAHEQEPALLPPSLNLTTSSTSLSRPSRKPRSSSPHLPANLSPPRCIVAHLPGHPPPSQPPRELPALLAGDTARSGHPRRSSAASEQHRHRHNAGNSVSVQAPTASVTAPAVHSSLMPIVTATPVNLRVHAVAAIPASAATNLHAAGSSGATGAVYFPFGGGNSPLALPTPGGPQALDNDTYEWLCAALTEAGSAGQETPPLGSPTTHIMWDALSRQSNFLSPATTTPRAARIHTQPSAGNSHRRAMCPESDADDDPFVPQQRLHAGRQPALDMASGSTIAAGLQPQARGTAADHHDDSGLLMRGAMHSPGGSNRAGSSLLTIRGRAVHGWASLFAGDSPRNAFVPFSGCAGTMAGCSTMGAPHVQPISQADGTCAQARAVPIANSQLSFCMPTGVPAVATPYVAAMTVLPATVSAVATAAGAEVQASLATTAATTSRAATAASQPATVGDACPSGLVTSSETQRIALTTTPQPAPVLNTTSFRQLQLAPVLQPAAHQPSGVEQAPRAFPTTINEGSASELREPEWVSPSRQTRKYAQESAAARQPPAPDPRTCNSSSPAKGKAEKTRSTSAAIKRLRNLLKLKPAQRQLQQHTAAAGRLPQASQQQAPSHMQEQTHEIRQQSPQQRAAEQPTGPYSRQTPAAELAHLEMRRPCLPGPGQLTLPTPAVTQPLHAPLQPKADMHAPPTSPPASTDLQRARSSAASLLLVTTCEHAVGMQEAGKCAGEHAQALGVSAAASKSTAAPRANLVKLRLGRAVKTAAITAATAAAATAAARTDGRSVNVIGCKATNCMHPWSMSQAAPPSTVCSQMLPPSTTRVASTGQPSDIESHRNGMPQSTVLMQLHRSPQKSHDEASLPQPPQRKTGKLCRKTWLETPPAAVHNGSSRTPGAIAKQKAAAKAAAPKKQPDTPKPSGSAKPGSKRKASVVALTCSMSAAAESDNPTGGTPGSGTPAAMRCNLPGQEPPLKKAKSQSCKTATVAGTAPLQPASNAEKASHTRKDSIHDELVKKQEGTAAMPAHAVMVAATAASTTAAAAGSGPSKARPATMQNLQDQRVQALAYLSSRSMAASTVTGPGIVRTGPAICGVAPRTQQPSPLLIPAVEKQVDAEQPSSTQPAAAKAFYGADTPLLSREVVASHADVPCSTTSTAHAAGSLLHVAAAAPADAASPVMHNVGVFTASAESDRPPAHLGNLLVEAECDASPSAVKESAVPSLSATCTTAAVMAPVHNAQEHVASSKQPSPDAAGPASAVTLVATTILATPLPAAEPTLQSLDSLPPQPPSLQDTPWVSAALATNTNGGLADSRLPALTAAHSGMQLAAPSLQHITAADPTVATAADDNVQRLVSATAGSGLPTSTAECDMSTALARDAHHHGVPNLELPEMCDIGCMRVAADTRTTTAADAKKVPANPAVDAPADIAQASEVLYTSAPCSVPMAAAAAAPSSCGAANATAEAVVDVTSAAPNNSAAVPPRALPALETPETENNVKVPTATDCLHVELPSVIPALQSPSAAAGPEIPAAARNGLVPASARARTVALIDGRLTITIAAVASPAQIQKLVAKSTAAPTPTMAFAQTSATSAPAAVAAALTTANVAEIQGVSDQISASPGPAHSNSGSLAGISDAALFDKVSAALGPHPAEPAVAGQAKPLLPGSAAVVVAATAAAEQQLTSSELGTISAHSSDGGNKSSLSSSPTLSTALQAPRVAFPAFVLPEACTPRNAPQLRPEHKPGTAAPRHVVGQLTKSMPAEQPAVSVEAPKRTCVQTPPNDQLTQCAHAQPAPTVATADPPRAVAACATQQQPLDLVAVSALDAHNIPAFKAKAADPAAASHLATDTATLLVGNEAPSLTRAMDHHPVAVRKRRSADAELLEAAPLPLLLLPRTRHQQQASPAHQQHTPQAPGELGLVVDASKQHSLLLPHQKPQQGLSEQCHAPHMAADMDAEHHMATCSTELQRKVSPQVQVDKTRAVHQPSKTRATVQHGARAQVKAPLVSSTAAVLDCGGTSHQGGAGGSGLKAPKARGADAHKPPVMKSTTASSKDGPAKAVEPNASSLRTAAPADSLTGGTVQPVVPAGHAVDAGEVVPLGTSEKRAAALAPALETLTSPHDNTAQGLPTAPPSARRGTAVQTLLEASAGSIAGHASGSRAAATDAEAAWRAELGPSAPSTIGARRTADAPVSAVDAAQLSAVAVDCNNSALGTTSNRSGAVAGPAAASVPGPVPATPSADADFQLALRLAGTPMPSRLRSAGKQPAPAPAGDDVASSSGAKKRKRRSGPSQRLPRMFGNVVALVPRVMLRLSETPLREKYIREAFGNTPDTSKALRVLNDEGKAERMGMGGRADPFMYKLTAAGLAEKQELRQSLAAEEEDVDDSGSSGGGADELPTPVSAAQKRRVESGSTLRPGPE